VNLGAKRADTPDVRNTTTDSYFVRLGGEPSDGYGPKGGAPVGREGLGSSAPPRHRKRKRGQGGKRLMILLLIVAVGSWTYWASQRPGGVNGTVQSWVSNVRGDVASVSADPDFAKARQYYNEQYKLHGSYPVLSEADLGGIGIGVGVSVQSCSEQAVVIQGASGGGTASRLLLAGRDLGELNGKYDCPTDLAHPSPWKMTVKSS
jgi:hypothetical protein